MRDEAGPGSEEREEEGEREEEVGDGYLRVD